MACLQNVAERTLVDIPARRSGATRVRSGVVRRYVWGLPRTQYSITGGPPSERGPMVVSEGLMSQPWARWTVSAIGWPGPIGSSPGGGSGGISGTT
jgi:hypothetical protein